MYIDVEELFSITWQGVPQPKGELKTRDPQQHVDLDIMFNDGLKQRPASKVA